MDAAGCLQSVHFDDALSATFLWLIVDRRGNKTKLFENKKFKHKQIDRDSICMMRDHFSVNLEWNWDIFVLCSRLS